MKEKTSILGSDISIWNLSETAEKIQSLVHDKGKHYVCVSNVHTVVMGKHDKDFALVTNKASLATPDGVPLIWASKFLKGPHIHGRASGPDILTLMLTDPKYASLSHFFYGSTPEVLTKLESSLRQKFPKAKLAGFLSPPFRKGKTVPEPLDGSELDETRILNASGADVIWVGLGAPKQEIWMYRARPHITSPVLVGVGAAFDFLSDNKKRAPEWMQRYGLEWLHRWSQEPARLATRYLSTNPKFVLGVIKQAFLQRLNSDST
jgi:N-acetylglucosaminyldiphosphoundecaprenol N-acetyl-beta-D-mannosaminyltransferase